MTGHLAIQKGNVVPRSTTNLLVPVKLEEPVRNAQAKEDIRPPKTLCSPMVVFKALQWLIS